MWGAGVGDRFNLHDDAALPRNLLGRPSWRFIYRKLPDIPANFTAAAAKWPTFYPIPQQPRDK